MEVVHVNGLALAFERVGQGPPLLFVHGAAEDSRIWRPQLASLSDEFTVVAWDEPGAGRSSDVPADFRLADYADCLARLIETLALGRVHVGGLSWGGTLVQELYRRRPELVATLILVDTYAGWKGSLPAAEVEARVEGARRMLAAPRSQFDPTLPGLFAGDPPAEFVALLAEIAADVRPESLRVQLELMAGADQRDLLPRITVPRCWSGASRTCAHARRRAHVRGGNPRCQAGPDSEQRSREQPRAAGTDQSGCARVLPRSFRSDQEGSQSRNPPLNAFSLSPRRLFGGNSSSSSTPPPPMTT